MPSNRPALSLQSIACAAVLLCSGTAFAQQNTTYQYQYDAMGNLTRITDPLQRVTDQQYDALNRLTQQQQPAPAAGSPRPVIRYGYDGQDQLISVTDPRNLVTAYTVDGLGNQTQLHSPDTGPTSKTHDAAGNLKTSTDAKGQTTRYQYDALNRVTQITYHDGKTVTYVYDVGQYAKGRLSSITDASGSIAYQYNQKGNIVAETRTIGSVAATTAYGYDSAGRLMSVTYPSGRIVNYQRDALGRIARIDTVKDNVSHTLVSQVTYHPFGGVKSFVNGANQTITRGMDLDGRTSSYTLGTQQYAVGYDAASRIQFLSDLTNPANTQSFGYDDLDRLTSYNGTGGSQTLSYDLTGNRTGKLVGTASTSYTMSAASNRLNQLAGAQNASIQTDPNGSIVNNGNNAFGYDARGRMVTADTALGPVQYKINALGQRVAKTVQGATTVFHYDLAGKLIGESGAATKEYVYLQDVPVALLQ